MSLAKHRVTDSPGPAACALLVACAGRQLSAEKHLINWLHTQLHVSVHQMQIDSKVRALV